MGVLNVVHDVRPALQTDHQEDGSPGHAHVVEGDGVLKRVLVAGPALGVVLVPIDTMGVIGVIVAEGLCALMADHVVVSGRRQINASVHTVVLIHAADIIFVQVLVLVIRRDWAVIQTDVSPIGV